jgi:hypothetical protein
LWLSGQEEIMNSNDLSVTVVGLISTLLIAFTAPAAYSDAPPASTGSKPRIVAGYGKLPLAFESNQGQSAKEVKFLAHGPGYSLFLTRTQAVLTLHKPNGARSPRKHGLSRGKQPFPPSAPPKAAAEPPSRCP